MQTRSRFPSRPTRLQSSRPMRPSGVSIRLPACGSAWNRLGCSSSQMGPAISAPTMPAASRRRSVSSRPWTSVILPPSMRSIAVSLGVQKGNTSGTRTAGLPAKTARASARWRCSKSRCTSRRSRSRTWRNEFLVGNGRQTVLGAALIQDGADLLQRFEFAFEHRLDARLQQLEDAAAFARLAVPPDEGDDDGDARLGQRLLVETDAERCERADFGLDLALEPIDLLARRHRLQRLQMRPQVRRQPPVAGQHLRQLVQRRAVSGNGYEPGGNRGVLAQHRLIEQDGRRLLLGQPVEEGHHAVDDRPAVAGERLGDQRA